MTHQPNTMNYADAVIFPGIAHLGSEALEIATNGNYQFWSVEDVQEAKLNAVTNNSEDVKMQDIEIQQERMQDIVFEVSFRGKHDTVVIPSIAKVGNLCQFFSEHLSLAGHTQRLIVRGTSRHLWKLSELPEDASIAELHGKKVLLLGSTDAELGSLKKSAVIAKTSQDGEDQVRLQIKQAYRNMEAKITRGQSVMGSAPAGAVDPEEAVGAETVEEITANRRVFGKLVAYNVTTAETVGDLVEGFIGTGTIPRLIRCPPGHARDRHVDRKIAAELAITSEGEDSATMPRRPNPAFLYAKSCRGCRNRFIYEWYFFIGYLLMFEIRRYEFLIQNGRPTRDNIRSHKEAVRRFRLLQDDYAKGITRNCTGPLLDEIAYLIDILELDHEGGLLDGENCMEWLGNDHKDGVVRDLNSFMEVFELLDPEE